MLTNTLRWLGAGRPVDFLFPDQISRLPIS